MGPMSPWTPIINLSISQKSKLPSVTGKSSSAKTQRRAILKTPARPIPKVQISPKSVTIQSEPMDDMSAPIPNLLFLGFLVSVQGGQKSTEWMEHPYYLQLPSLLLPKHSC